jgi:hypothetical protein
MKAQLLFPSAAALTLSNTYNVEIGSCLPSTDDIDSKGLAAMDNYAPSWQKFCSLADLLEMSTAEVAEWLPRKKFATFTGHEMSSLIRALFEDSPRRTFLLKTVMGT